MRGQKSASEEGQGKQLEETAGGKQKENAQRESKGQRGLMST